MPPRVPLVVAATLGIWVAAAPATAHDRTFDAWLAELRAEALKLGIREATLDKALTGLQPIARVVELDRRQPEVTQTFVQYMARRISPALVEQGRRAYRRHRAVLEAVGAKYGVQPRFIVALWGLESRYGRHTGGFSVIAALATLAFDAGDHGRRVRAKPVIEREPVIVVVLADTNADFFVGSVIVEYRQLPLLVNGKRSKVKTLMIRPRLHDVTHMPLADVYRVIAYIRQDLGERDFPRNHDAVDMAIKQRWALDLSVREAEAVVAIKASCQ